MGYLVRSQGSGSVVGCDKGDVQEFGVSSVLPERAQDVRLEVVPAETEVVRASHFRREVSLEM